jgi:hypothetical protein
MHVCVCVCVCVDTCEIVFFKHVHYLYKLKIVVKLVGTSASLGPGFKHQPGTRLSRCRIFVSFLQFLQANMPIQHLN